MNETTTSVLGECAHCGKKVGCGSLFCSHECKENFDRRKQLDVLKYQYKQQKHEEIKRMAWELSKEMLMDQVRKEKTPNFKVYHNAWVSAEAFYNFAKEKQEGASDE